MGVTSDGVKRLFGELEARVCGPPGCSKRERDKQNYPVRDCFAASGMDYRAPKSRAERFRGWTKAAIGLDPAERRSELFVEDFQLIL
jgi:hypothetical protein